MARFGPILRLECTMALSRMAQARRHFLPVLLLPCIAFMLVSPSPYGKEDSSSAIVKSRLEFNGWILDKANVLSPEAETKINQVIDRLHATNGSEIAVTTITSVPADQTPKQLATSLFHEWGIGKAGVDNGLLFLISVKDRRMEVETGYGAEAWLPDAKVGRILRESVRPRFGVGDYEGGILAGTQAFADVLMTANFTASTGLKRHSFDLAEWIVLASLGSALVGLVGIKLLQDSTVKREPEGFTRTKGAPTSSAALPTVVWGVVFFGSVATSSLLVWVSIASLPLWMLGIGLIVANLIADAASPRWVQALTSSKWPSAKVRCSRCGELMEPIVANTLAALLSKPERAAEALGSVRFEAWRCGHCHPLLSGAKPKAETETKTLAQNEIETTTESEPADRTSDLHLYAVDQPNRFQTCTHCSQNALVVTKRRIRQPWLGLYGMVRVKKICEACGFEETLIVRTSPTDAGASTDGGWSDGGESGAGGSSGGSDFGGGGSDFGGGDSGGGGAGDSW